MSVYEGLAWALCGGECPDLFAPDWRGRSSISMETRFIRCSVANHEK